MVDIVEAASKREGQPALSRASTPIGMRLAGARAGVSQTKRKWHELDLLCRSGVGLILTAPSICRVLRELIGADAASLFWLDDAGMPAGLFHENASQEAIELFVNEYDRLFTGPGEINVSQIAAHRGRPAGVLFNPDPLYLKSNTLNLLLRPSQHRHTLDLRIDVGGQARAVVMLFREESRPFREADLFLISQAIPYLQNGLEERRHDIAWERSGARGHLLVNPSGDTLLMIDDQARALLDACTIVGQDAAFSTRTRSPPRFIRELCRQLHTLSAGEVLLDLGAGRLQALASKVMSLEPGGDAQVVISLEMLRPRPLRTVENILSLPLSPLQRSIALDAAMGGSRSDSLVAGRVGKEAMKKHLATIYRIVGVNSWDDLGRVLA